MEQPSENPGLNIKFDSNGNFTVGESKLLNYIFGSLFLIMFLVVFSNSDFGEYWMLDLFLLFIPLHFFSAGLRKGKKITVNATGIYHSTNLITGWANFRMAYIRQLPNNFSGSSRGLTDHYRIVVEYFDFSKGLDYLYSIPLSESQDKSEYDIIDAIMYFSGKQLSYEIYD